MLLSLNWLKDFIDIPKNISPEKLGELLTLHTVEVEGIRNMADSLDKVVVGKILKLEKHPNADRLKLAEVDVKKSKIKVVCGGSNLRKGMLVAFAKVGAKIKWHAPHQNTPKHNKLATGQEFDAGQGQGESVILEAAKIRGVESKGMICSASELGLEELFPAKDELEVVDLTPPSPSLARGGMKVGMPLAEALGLDDVVYDIDNKSMTHRPDLWGHYGIARELATLMATNLKRIATNKIQTGNSVKIDVKVEDAKLCPRYMAVGMSGIKIKPSEQWMQKRLIACGMRPINNIVDISNYAMLELGQPTHAFGMSRIATNKKTNSHPASQQAGCGASEINTNSHVNIVVRCARKGETIKTLDGEKKELDSDMLLITDGQKPVAIAGVMGGENSEVSNKTTSIVLESANFDPVSIRKTSQKLGLRSEASQRFEKSLDPNLCELALNRIVALIKESCPKAEVASEVADVQEVRQPEAGPPWAESKKYEVRSTAGKPIKLDLEWLEQRTGVKIPKAKVVSILESLGFIVKGSSRFGAEADGSVLNVTAPTWRATKDISIPEDLVEEVARIYGYKKIKPAMPKIETQTPEVNEEQEFINKIKDILLAAGMTETYNYSFVNEQQLQKLGIDDKNHIRLANPLSKECTLLRQSLVPNLLNNVVTNQRTAEVIKLFEIGSVFLPQAGKLAKGGGDKGKLPEQPIKFGLVYASNEKNIFNKLKGIVEHLFEKLNIEIKFEIKEINKTLAGKVGIKTNVVMCELDIIELLQAHKKAGIKKYAPKNKFPFVHRDMAFVIDEKILYNDIRDEIVDFSDLIQEVELFDVYTGKEVGAGKKNLAFHIAFGHPGKTLTGEEVDDIQKKLVQHLHKKFNAQLRDF